MAAETKSFCKRVCTPHGIISDITRAHAIDTIEGITNNIFTDDGLICVFHFIARK